MTKLSAFDSKSLAYAAITAALGGFRGIFSAAPIAANAILQEASKLAEKHKIADLPEFVGGVQVAIAGHGAVAIADLAAGNATLPEAGDDGFVISLVGVRGIPVYDAAGNPAKTDEGKPETRNGAIALALYPAYSLDAILATDEGRAWLKTQADKEAGLVAFRSLRLDVATATIADLMQAAVAMPVSLSDYTDRTRASAAESFAVFNDNWAAFVTVLASRTETASLVAALPAKKDVLASIRSRVYAQTLFPKLEEFNIFVRLGTAFAASMQRVADEAETPVAFDPAAITRWIEGRDALDLLPKAQVGNVDLSALDLSAFGV